MKCGEVRGSTRALYLELSLRAMVVGILDAVSVPVFMDLSGHM
jgi:hypothetical protein